MSDESNVLGDVSIGRKVNKLPDTLFGYRRTREYFLSSKTILDYEGRWSKYLSLQTEEGFSSKILGLIGKVRFEIITGQYSLSAFSKMKAVLCFGLSTIIDEKGNLYPEYINGIDEEDFYEDAYIQVKNMEYYNGVMLDNKKADSAKVEISAGDQLTTTTKKESITDEDDRVAIPRNKLGFPKDVYQWLLKQNGRSSVSLLQLFLKANLLIGLEPVEWLYMRMAVEVKTKAPVIVIDRSTDQHDSSLMRTLKLTGATNLEKKDILDFKEAFDQILFEDAELIYNKFKQYLELFSDEKRNMYAESQNSLARLYDLNGKTTIPDIALPMEDLVDWYMNPQHELALNRLEKMQRTLQRLLKKCPHLPNDVSSSLTLHNTRHQVIANAKASKMSKVEIAAFFGLSSLQAAQQQSSKVDVGWRRFTFEPDVESVVRLSSAKIIKSKEDVLGDIKPTLAELYKDW